MDVAVKPNVTPVEVVAPTQSVGYRPKRYNGQVNDRPYAPRHSNGEVKIDGIGFPRASASEEDESWIWQ